ncbi:conserved hypothetical protein [Neospora caninum Liverpool]|uniref:Uncharacterized protein n=1 Tax=Neospora caninum (strain Liverpool) TaxID=572307 RepID=F0V8S4_NEOCL|nr:conserved hypothetical protein [Neospora caninum Liverpool]CBZ50115.1 conserved hypothetical protein [Neospora caninum Liverpool]CEL64709.1 TPA: hypothetical protein BN1204_005910 [Neospora caninum Liverpool]|eukprot:XP_003880150.1 conserved hypothetical protein [Neospora caninum Liverpool]
MDAFLAEAAAALPDVPTAAAAAIAAGQTTDQERRRAAGVSDGGNPVGREDLLEDEDAVHAVQRKKEGISTPAVQQKLLTVEGKEVAVICVTFSDKFFVTISDNGKMSAMIQGSAGFEEQRADFGVRFIFGDRHREYFLVYARALLAIISAQSKKEFLLAISISVDSPSFFRAVMSGIRANFHFN